MRSPFRALSAALLLLASGCAPSRSWNVLLVTLDTTRADHLSCYGYEEYTTPNLDRLAKEGVRFSNAFTTNPITLPAHTSIMTGTYPVHHQVRDNSTYFVDDGLTTLAETLSGAGYDTAAVVGAFVLDHRFNLDQGFQLYDDRVDENWSRDEIEARDRDAFGFAERKANLVTLAALQWLDQRQPERPFFLWLHYFDPHQPTNPPEPHHSHFASPYDGEVAFADEQLGRVLDDLRRRGELDRTLVVATADHGEGLFDHGEPTHALLVFDSTMHVPLLLRVPGGPRGMVDSHLASTVDIAPTILDLLDLPGSREFQGRSLAPWIRGENPRWDERVIYMESMVGFLEFGWAPLRALRTAEEKLIVGARPRYFRVADDPTEIYDRAKQEPAAVERLTRRLERALASWSRDDERVERGREIDAEAAAKLAALGYVASPRLSPARALRESLDNAEQRDDPIDRRRVFDLFGVASENLRTGAIETGIRQLQEVLDLDPANPTALIALGKAYLVLLSQPETARIYLERAVAADPNQEEGHFFLSRLFLLLGDLDSAQLHAEAILAFHSKSLPALLQLGAIADRRGRSDEARARFEEALEIDPSNVGAIVSLGASYGRSGNPEKARRMLERASELAPGDGTVLYNTGILKLLNEDRAGAEADLTLALEREPDSPDIQFVLGRLLLQRGERERAESLLRQARRTTSDPERLSEIDELLARQTP